MKKLIFIVITVLFIISSVNAQVKILTLKESMEIGFRNSKDLIISNSKVIGSGARIDETSSQMLPQLKFSAGYTRLSEISPFVVTLPFYSKPIELAPVFLDNYTFRVSVQQPLFTGFRLSSLKNAAEFNRDAAEEDMVKDKNELAMNIEISFWNFYKMKLLKNLFDEEVKQAERHVEDTKNFLKNGMATQNDLLKLQVQYSNVRLQQIDAQNNLDLARASFNKTIGLPMVNETDIDTTRIQIIENKYNLRELVAEARSNRSELRSLNLRIEASNENLDAARSGWFPNVSLTGNWYMSKPNQRLQPPVDIFKGTWDVGISLSWDIWDWGNRQAQSQEAEQTLIQTRTSYDQVKDAVELEVNQNYMALIYDGEKLQVSRESIEQAEENYRSIQDKYNVQLATSTDLIDAENSLLQARTNYMNATIDYQLGKAKLEKAIGRAIYKF
ncbi:MAG: TolC family protein [Ignavibacteria bacterium]|jgi:outer membrane protein TolC